MLCPQLINLLLLHAHGMLQISSAMLRLLRLSCGSIEDIRLLALAAILACPLQLLLAHKAGFKGVLTLWVSRAAVVVCRSFAWHGLAEI
jgi:hypothetical protein